MIPILLGYLLLAFYGIDRQSLWVDEIMSVKFASSTAPIWDHQRGPLYFALLRLWIHAGTSEFVLRSLSVLLGAMAVCLFYALSLTLFNRRVAVIGHTGRGNYGHGLDVVWQQIEGVQIVAVADANRAGLANELKKLKIERGYADFRER